VPLSGMSDSEGRCLGAKKVREVHVTQRSSDPNRQRHWRYGSGFAGMIAAVTVVLAGCSGAHSESPAPVVVTNTNLPVTVTNAASPFVITGNSAGPALNSGVSSLPASTGLYRFDAFYYNCAPPAQVPSNVVLEVVAGPDAHVMDDVVLGHHHCLMQNGGRRHCGVFLYLAMRDAVALKAAFGRFQFLLFFPHALPQIVQFLFGRFEFLLRSDSYTRSLPCCMDGHGLSISYLVYGI